MLNELQTQIDDIKQQLLGINNYAALSGLGALTRHHIINPYLVSMETGIDHTLTPSGDVASFSYNFKGTVHKHYIDESSLKDPKGTSVSNFSVFEDIPSGSLKPFGDYTAQEISSMAQQAEVAEEIKEKMIKQAEKDFFAASLEFFKNNI